MNWLDSAIALFNPVAGVRRGQARMALQQIRMYEAAKPSRFNSGAWAPGTSANVEIGSSFARVRNSTRQMIRDNEYASRGLDALVSLTVGTGPTAVLPDQALWARWTQECDFEGQLDLGGLIELIHRTRRESGECIIRFHNVDPDTAEVPLKIQVLEPDHLDDTRTEVLANGNFIIYGIEFTPQGQRVAYYLWPVHPGEVGNMAFRSIQSERVPASEVLHYYRKRRPSQVRGMTEFGTALLRLRNIADYELAELVRKKIESCFVAFVRTDSPSEQLGQITSTSPRQEKMAPGMIKYLPNSDSVTFGSPANTGGYGEFTEQQLHAVAAGIGATYEMLTGDHSKLSFSGGRLSRLALLPLIEQEQWLCLVPMVLNPIARRFQITAKLAGRQRGPIAPVAWTMPRAPLQDVLKEAMGLKQLVLGGLMSLPEAIRELGYDPEQVLNENKDYRAALLEAGVLVDTDPAVAGKLIAPDAMAKLLDSLIAGNDEGRQAA